MLRQDLTARSLELRAARVPFVHARVTLAEAPTSAKPGDEAIVLADGSIEGFVGGACAETTVRESSIGVLGTGEPVVLRITPEPEPAQPGKAVVHNPCLSGGTLEVFLEPVVPPPLVVVVGGAPIARALAAVGAGLGWAVERYDGAVPGDAAALVVASHGRGEEEALVAALETGVPYVGLVASRRRGAAVVASLEVPPELRARVHTPAGLDLGATTPGEVALSILAEVVQSRRGLPPLVATAPSPPAGEPSDRSIDPVCGMTVFHEEHGLVVEHEGHEVWFCGRGCRDAFVADPGAYTS
ncbi:MAG TPA: XdhC family protein [Acidimicrobiales bacterium]|nr:XdhC family protein [Acidimicrobiales bacterium]